jgi:hypothetical protein
VLPKFIYMTLDGETYMYSSTVLIPCSDSIHCSVYISFFLFQTMRSQDHEFVVVRRTINLGTRNLEWGGNGEGMGRGLRKGSSVYE